jgi:ABC-type multidrug transport system fused ATPase/permease subunit
VGFSGAGKSTLVDLVPRFIDPTSGAVKLGGVDIRQLRLEDLRSKVTMVGQHTFLFNDTVYNNIAYGNPAASADEVFAAARAAFAYDFIMKLSSGFDTLVGEGGMTLSGGERQRLAIARAILKNAPILILDEATASLDNRAEREVQLAIEALEQGRTTIVIAHRLSTVRDADMLVVMSGGSIVERGTHQELLEKEGEYSRLHALQFREPDAA